MKRFNFDVEDIEKMLSGGARDPWRELILLADEVMKLKADVRKLKKIKAKVDDE